jgi:hypothetical protein
MEAYLMPNVFGQTTPFSQYIDPRRNALMGAAAGLGSTGGVGDMWRGAMQGMALDRDYAMDAEQKAQEEASKNATIEWLQSQGYGDLVQMAQATGDIGAAWTEGLKRSQPKAAQAPIEINGQLVDPVTYEVLGDFRDPQPTGLDPEKLFGMEKDLAAQYGGQDPVKTYQAVRNGYERVRASATENTGAGDISMIFAYMKMLDPTSVVREGEFATAETAGGAGEQIANLYNRVLSGERLTPELRKEFLAAADKLYQESSQNLSALNEQYTTRAGAWGVDPTRFVVSPETYQPVGGAGPRTTSTGVNWSF